MATETKVDYWLSEAIRAAKAGHTQAAQELLLKVIEADDQDETAWVWLSKVVETEEDRRLCLENIRLLNPDNSYAQAALNQLESATTENAKATQRHHKSFIAESSYDDVWARNTPLCAYCAHEVGEEDKSCLQCHKGLTAVSYQYPKPSSNLYILFVMLLGIGQLFMIQAIYALLAAPQYNLLVLLLPLSLMALFFILAIGVYYRQAWAHLTAIGALITILLLTAFMAVAPLNPTNLGFAADIPIITALIQGFGQGATAVIRTFQTGAIILGLIYSIFLAGPDFQKQEVHQTAKLNKGLSHATEFHEEAKRLMKEGKWASAILHWQRAVAKEPQILTYQRYLAIAYAQLGFYERSLDILQSAQKSISNPQTQAKLQRIIDRVQEMAQTS